MSARREAMGVALAALVAASGGENGGVEGVVRLAGEAPAGAVVFLVPEALRPFPVPAGAVVMDQRKLRFVPDVVAVWSGQPVEFRNSDPLLHNIFSPDTAESFDLGTYPQGQSRSHRFETSGPHVILCNIHPEMEAWVFVAEGPHAVTDTDGKFRIGDVPPGRYRLRVWHRHAGPYEAVVVVPPAGMVRVDVELDQAPER